MLSDQNSFFNTPSENPQGPVDPGKLRKQLHALQYKPSGPDPLDYSHYDGGSPPYSDEEDLDHNLSSPTQNSDHLYFEIDTIRDKRISEEDHSTEYLIKYVGYSSDHNEWLDSRDLLYCQDKIEEYENSLGNGGQKRKRKQERKGLRKRVKGEVLEAAKRDEVNTRQGSFEQGDQIEDMDIVEIVENAVLVFEVKWIQKGKEVITPTYYTN